MILPEPFTERLAQIVPSADFLPVLATFAATKPTAFRVNTLLADVEAVRAGLTAHGFTLTPVPWLAEAFTVPEEQRRALTESAEFAARHLYIQNLASMLAAPLLDPAPGETILDLAAAPGGKTLHLAARMGNQGQIRAVEPVRGRYHKLRATLREYGVAIAWPYQMDGRAAGRRWPAVFDRVLLDAPCSSEARFRLAQPESWAHWSPRKIKETAHKQHGLMRAALEALRPGGLLLYCTCAFAPEENELVIDGALRRGGVRIEPLTLPIPNTAPGLTTWKGRDLHPDLVHLRRVWPTAQMDGFALALLRRDHD
jgi:16S rRNA (cytosine1407-C5)-methyltransferase